MVMGAKNMTMTEVQHAKRVGGCQPALGSPVTRFDLAVALGCKVDAMRLPSRLRTE